MATSISTRKTTRWKRVLDFLAVAAPIICLIDCVVLPVVSALLPFVGMEQVSHGLINDQLVLLMVLAICLPIIVPGFLKHKNKRVLGMFSAAILLMSIASFDPVPINEGVHMCISLFAAILLISANRENKRLLGCGCNHHHEAGAGAVLSFHADESHHSLIANSHSQTAFDHGINHHHEHQGPCIHEVVIALERVESLVPEHFEPRSNLSFDPTTYDASSRECVATGCADVESLTIAG